MRRCEWCDAGLERKRQTPVRRHRFCSRKCQVVAYYFERKARESEEGQESKV